MKEIILPTELMAFFILNMFGHDSSLHDFSTSSELGKSRVLSVLRSSTPSSPGSGSFGGGTWSGKGGGDEELNAATTQVYARTVGPTLYTCLQSTGFFDITRNGVTRSDSFIVVDAKLAMGAVFSGRNINDDNKTGIKIMGIAPGFIYLPEKTYSPFEFNVNARSTIDSDGYARDQITYQHHSEPLAIQINRAGPSFSCIITRNGVVTTYNLLSSDQDLIPQVSGIIATNPDVSYAFMSNAVSTSITNYVDYIQLLLDGADSRYTFILTDYITFKCMRAGEEDLVTRLVTEGKGLLTTTIREFWTRFSQVDVLANITAILTKIDEIQRMVALIYKAILCAVGSAVKADLYSCRPPPIAQLSDIEVFYLANKSQLEMFVYEYMVSVMNFNDIQTNQLKDKCNALIQGINTNVTSSLSSIITGITANPPTSDGASFRAAILPRLQGLSIEYDLKFEAPPEITELFLTQYPVTYFVNIENPADISSAIQLTTFINFLQIVSDTLIDKEEIQELIENEVVYVDNTTTKDKEDYIRALTDLPIIAANPAVVPSIFNPDRLRLLIELVRQTLILLFDGKIPEDPEDPDYTIILTDAVGSDNVETIKGFLSSPDAVDRFTAEQLQVAAELLQTLFLGLINRLDSDQLTQVIGTLEGKNLELFGEIKLGGGGQSGGAKKKPGYLFIFSDAIAFFIQLTKQNRLTKMKSKFKELFDTTDVLPAFYTDLILQPSLANALSWTINFNTVFLGFFLNSENLAITDISASVDFGVIFPQIPSNVIDDLTLDDVLTQNFSLIDMARITSLQALGEKTLNVKPLPSPSGTFTDIIKIITGLNLPGIFIKPDEGSDIFWRFEQGYIYLLKCVVFYGVLVTGVPSGCNTLITNGFIGTGQAICPTPDDDNLNAFLVLFFSCTNRYLELLTKINELLSTGSVLSGSQKLCTGYALGCVLTSIMTEMNPIISSFKNSALLNIETTEITRILTKKANASTILQSSTFGDNDTKLYNKFLNWVNNNNFQRGDNTVFSDNDNIRGKLSESLRGEDAKWNKTLLTDIDAQYGGEGKFYINNAVNAPSALGKLGRGYFCPAASIADNQATCSTKASAESNEGFEIGIMDFIIHDGRPFGQETGMSPKMIYRVRVVPMGDGSTCKIGAYLSIEDNVLINVADADIWKGRGGDWPNPNDAHPPITVPLNSRRGDIIPMDAKTCLKNIFATIDSVPFKPYNATGFQSLIDALEKPVTLPLRRLILESSFVKGLGDFLQEAVGFVENSGYEVIPVTIPAKFIRLPNEGRLQLNNDRPSSVRAILFVLYGKNDINPNVIAGFLTEMKDKKKIPKSKYALAGRLTRGGGRNTKKTKVSKRNKQSKRNKTTRRIKMKTRANKLSKRQKKLKVRKTHKMEHSVKI